MPILGKSFKSIKEKGQFRKVLFVSYLLSGMLLLLSPAYVEDLSVSPPANSQPSVNHEPSVNLEVITFYEVKSEGRWNMNWYYYGLYINLPLDTTGVANKIMDFVRDKASKIRYRDAMHVWGLQINP
ncbi:MAG: hypothetical protein EBX41_01920 [Chitinophagia bacterium]|nr:hypothetical protein [Chitinophagia bacterium]